jgi:hypothetical protein
MTSVRPESPHSPGHDPVVVWRTLRLREAGLAIELAAALAQDRRYDLHAVLELVDRGCPAPIAARILAPLDDPPRPC